MKIKLKLPKQIKDRWVKALRSGQYTQGEASLYGEGYDQNRYCCLGVLGKVCNIHTDVLLDMHYLFNVEKFNNGCQLPAFFKNKDEQSPGAVLQTKLAKMNDSGKWSFKRIASYIEKYL